MYIDKLILKDTNEEVLPHADKPFPHSSYYVEPNKYPGKNIPWHWHEDLEVMYVIRGEIEIKTVNNTFILSEGESAFINTIFLSSDKSWDVFIYCVIFLSIAIS